MTLELTKEQARELAAWIEISLFTEIRNDHEIDSLSWVEEWIKVIRKLEEGGQNVV